MSRSRKDFYERVGSKRQSKDNMDQCIGSGSTVTRNIKNARILSAFLAFVFTSRICPPFSQVAEISEGICGNKALPTARAN